MNFPQAEDDADKVRKNGLPNPNLKFMQDIRDEHLVEVEAVGEETCRKGVLVRASA